MNNFSPPKKPMNNFSPPKKPMNNRDLYTSVFWDVEDYPIPADLTPSSIYLNIKSALAEKIRLGTSFEIQAYGAKMNQITEDEVEKLLDGGIWYTAYDVPRITMVRDILSDASIHRLSNLMVISKSLLEDKESKRVLRALKSRGCKVFLVQPQPEIEASEKLFHTPALLLSAMDESGTSLVVNTSHGSSQDFSEPLTSVSGHKTGVFWDVEDCPFPNDLDPESIFQRIKLALEEKDYSGVMSIWAYAEKIPFSDDMLDKYQKSRIYFVPEVPGNKTERVRRMVSDVQLWGMDSYADYFTRANVIVISNDTNTLGDIDFNDCLNSMHARRYSAFLVQPKDIAQEKPKTSDWPRCILDKGVSVGMICETSNNLYKKKKKKVKKHNTVEEETMNNQDFSKRIAPVSEPSIGVFWDVEDCPFPNDLDPESIFQRIESALESKDYSGVMSIWAYAEKLPFSDDMRDKYQKSRIYFVPEVSGNKTERVHRLIHDMFLWEMDTPEDYRPSSSAIVISDDISGEISLAFSLICLIARGVANTFLVQPCKLTSNHFESSIWPRCLLDVGEIVVHPFPVQPSSEQKRMKKPKLESPKAEEQSSYSED